MFRTIRYAWRLSLLAGLASSAIYLYPAARFTYQFAVSPDDPVAAAELRLSALDADDFENEAREALAEYDPELARSIAHVAAERGHPIPDDLMASIEKADEFSFTQTASDTWSGLVSGNTDTPAAFAGSLVADLSVAGDIRDIYGEVVKYPDYDEVTVALSAVGIVATGATVASGMNALPAKAGVSLLKSAKKAGKLPKPLERELGAIVSNSVDIDAARDALRSAGKLDGNSALAAMRRVVRPDVLDRVSDAAASFGGVAVRQGYRGSLQTLRMAESTDDIRRMEKVSARFGDGYRGTLRFAAKAGSLTLRVGEALLLMAGWIAGFAMWLVGFGLMAFDLTRTVIRFVQRPSRRVAA
ncbi:hypothetical protein GOB57_09460 [Sinorhizobium meliloti]|nr:hypothetical protein [Sinorhizobium meliloti]